MPNLTGFSQHRHRIPTAVVIGLLFVFHTVTSRAESPSYDWINSAGGEQHDYGTDVAIDPAGNTYVTGYFRDKASFDKTVLVTLTGEGESDMFISKYDRVGHLAWARRIGGDSDDMARGVTVDGQGNVYICGSFLSSEIDFGQGNVVKRQADQAIFIAKYAPDGKLHWVRTAGSGPGGTANDVAIDPEGNVYLTGYFLGQGVFGDLVLDNSGYIDIFVARYDPTGELIWVRQIGGKSDDVATAIVVDEQGSSYISGAFSEEMRVSRGIRLESEGLFDTFVIKLDADGRTAWAESEGGYMNDIRVRRLRLRVSNPRWLSRASPSLQEGVFRPQAPDQQRRCRYLYRQI